MNREAWLMDATRRLRPLFAEHGYTVPDKIRVSCGWPSIKAMGRKSRRIGECWPTQCSKDGTWEIFISPILAKPLDVLDVLVHEIVHAVVGIECGHRGPFRVCATKLGLTGKMTATEAGPELKARLNGVSAGMASYPHAPLDGKAREKKQSTRMLKLTCPSAECGYVVRTTRKWLDVGVPTCCCGETMEADSSDSSDADD